MVKELLLLIIVFLALIFVVDAKAETWVDEVNQTTYQPALAYGFTTEYTTANKTWFWLLIAASVGDVVSTRYALDNGGVEANPFYGDNPSVAVLVLGKVLFIGAAYGAVEYLVAPENRQNYRNWIYGTGAAIFTAATVNNYLVAD